MAYLLVIPTSLAISSMHCLHLCVSIDTWKLGEYADSIGHWPEKNTLRIVNSTIGKMNFRECTPTKTPTSWGPWKRVAAATVCEDQNALLMIYWNNNS